MLLYGYDHLSMQTSAGQRRGRSLGADSPSVSGATPRSVTRYLGQRERSSTSQDALIAEFLTAILPALACSPAASPT
jgi:hypothetical protein